MAKKNIVILGTKGDDFINVLDGLHDPNANYLIQALFGDDIVIGGNGKDKIFGSSGNDTLMGIGGDDTLFGGHGDDLLVGTVVEASITVTPDFSEIIVSGSKETLRGEAGDDLIVGGSLFFTLHALTDDITIVNSGGDNILYGGNGNDIMYGGNGFISYVNDLDPSIPITLNQTNFTGNNTLYGGDGDDLLVGGNWDVTIDSTNWFIEGVRATLLAHDFVSPSGIGNHLIGGAGNDTLIGDNGIFIEILPNIIGFNIHDFGGDVLEGEDGNDLLIGDVSFLQTVVGGFLVEGEEFIQEENFGSDTLIGGLGNDTLVGDVFIIGEGENAILSFADDTFVFALDSNFGNDVITDMNVGGVFDTLKFTGLHGSNPEAEDVDAAIANFMAGDEGQLLVNFNSGASISFANIQFDGQDSILDITPSIITVE